MANDEYELEKGENLREDINRSTAGSPEDDESRHSRNTSSIDGIQETPLDDDEDEAPGLAHTKSRSSSTKSRTIIKVPRHKRRGLFARFALMAEVENPYFLSRGSKWLITLVVALAAVAAPMGSAIFYPALDEISKDFNTSATITNLSIAMYILSMGIFPLWWSSFSETFGRRTIYLVSFSIGILFNVLSAISTSITMLVIMRTLGGGAAASVQAVGAGTIADIWEVQERGKAMGIFYLGPLCGPLLAPVIGGVLAEKWGWRSTQWFLTIYTACCLLMILFCLPETKKSLKTTVEIDEKANEMTRVSTTQSLQQKTKKFAVVLKGCLIDPLAIVANLRFPAISIVVCWASVTFGCLYVLNISTQQTFHNSPYSFSTIIVGLLYMPASLGYFFASVFGGRWNDHIMHREARKANRISPTTGKLLFLPEDRMRENVYLAAVVYPAALIMYGWVVQKGLIWIIPMIATFFFGFGSMIIFGVGTTMLTEFMPKKSSSGVALNNLIRNVFACVGGIVAAPLIDAIGNGWLFTALGLISGLSGLGIILSMRRWGEKWRRKMDLKLTA